METETTTNVSGQSVRQFNKSISAGNFFSHQQLTRREIQIIRMVAKGHTDKEIAHGLNISFHTVRTHRKNIFQKTNLHNIGGLICYAMRHNILEQMPLCSIVDKKAIIYN